MSIEVDSPLTALGQGLMFSLVLQSRQRATRYQSLSVILPFLNLNTQLASIHGYGRSSLSPMIWPVMWSSGWSGETVNHQGSLSSRQGVVNHTFAATGEQVARTFEKSIQRTERNNISQPINPTHRNMLDQLKSERVISHPTNPNEQFVPLNQQTPMPEDLVKPFVWHNRLGEGKHVISTTPLAEAWPRLSAQMKPGNTWPQKKTITEGSSDISTDQPAPIVRDVPERQALPELNPALVGILGVASGRYTEINQGLERKQTFPASSANDLLVFEEMIMPSVDSQVPMDRTEYTTPLPTRLVSSPIPRNNRKPEQSFLASFQSLNIITSILEQLVRREVTSEMKHQHQSESQITGLHSDSSIPGPTQPINDDVVRQIMYRMRDLTQAESFRMGRIR